MGYDKESLDLRVIMLLPINFIAKSTGSNGRNAEIFQLHLSDVCEKYDINTKARICAFLSQIGHESAGMSRLQENLNYSSDALMKLFGRSRISSEDCARLGRNSLHPADQKSIANTIYGGDWGKRNLGNLVYGDGWKHRGMGLKQLTGLDNHTRCGKALGLDLISYPELLLIPEHAAMSAGWFWNANGLNAIADRKDIPMLTKKINGGDFGLAERTKLFNAAMSYDLVI
ncbi:COG3179 Predicted chitinase [uncultured Caudovirales phage]|uniref:COG3179 Predicted chitinase n=1 Tax=uncultured Caudovirales phage TaxID=2100421 RepID=A0A6J7W7W6_9CAUD|nr:COG3179 Predicted chitinase [uncultured Caudovirales phage]